MRPFSAALLLLAWASPALANQGASVAALTPGRDGRAELHIELRDEALRADLLKAPSPERFRVLIKAGQARVRQAEVIASSVEGFHTVLAFDQSASFRPYLNEALALAHRFLGASPGGAFTVLSFGTSLGEPKDGPTPLDAQRLLAEVAKSKPQFQTRLKASIREAVGIASQRVGMPKGGRQVVVFTDAGEESSVFTTDQVIGEARLRGVRVHTVVLGASKGTTLAQRRDDMKRLAEETGGASIEVQERGAAGAALEAVARSSWSLVRLGVEFCDVPASPPLREEQAQVEVLRGGSVVATTSWVSFSQQAGGASSRPCVAPAVAVPSSRAPVLPAEAPVPRATTPWALVGGLGVLGLGAVLLAFLVRGRRREAPPPPAPAPATPPSPALPSAAPWVNPQAAPTGSVRPGEESLWLVAQRAPLGTRLVRLGQRPVLVGASSEAELRLEINEVSGRHALVERGPRGEVLLTDQGSTNGTFLDGQRLAPGQPTPWKPGQIASFSTKVEIRLEVRAS
jgi:hypothetical protein